MSKKNNGKNKRKQPKKQNQRKDFPWAPTLVGGILLIVLIFQLVGVSGASSADDGGTPRIAVEESNIDLGYIKLGEYRSLKIKVTNSGDGTLRFKEQHYIEVLDGCCPPQLTISKMSLKPGESTYVQSPDFMMHEGMDGKHDFAIHLKTNDPANPDFSVHVLSDWGL